MAHSSAATHDAAGATDPARNGSIVFHVWTQEDVLVSALRDLFDSIGYEVVEIDRPEQVDINAPTGTSHLVIIGSDTAQPLDKTLRIQQRIGAATRIACATIAQPSAEVEAGFRRAGIPLAVAGADVYATFERVAAIFDFDVHADVFVSYSSKDKIIADCLTDELRRRGLRSWIDRRNLRASEQWQQALRRGVETSGAFLFLVSRVAIASKYCQEELGWAEELGKRIIPVVIEAIPNDQLPRLVAERQFISASPADRAEPSISDVILDEIVAAVQRDPDDIRIHRDLLARALAWRADDDDPDKLLRGRELQEAEDWIGQAVARNRWPRPVSIQAEFVTASRAAARRQRRTRQIIVAVTLLVTIGLAIWAVLNAIDAGRQAREARSRLAEQRAFGAFVDWDADPIKAFLQADSALRTAPEGDVLRSGYDQMAKSLGEMAPESVANLEASLSAAAFSRDLNRMAIQSVSGPALLIDLTSAGQHPVSLRGEQEDSTLQLFKFSADGRLVAGIGRARFAANVDPFGLYVWRTDTGGLVGSVVLGFSGGLIPPEILGFAHDNLNLVIRSSRDPTASLAYVFATDALAAGPVRAPWRSDVEIGAGSIDLASGTIVQIERTAGQTLIHFVDIATGQPVFPWPPVSVEGNVRQAYLTRDRHALVVNLGSPGADDCKIIALKLSSEGSTPLGPELTARGAPMIWRASQDGSVIAVINAKADFPAELWLLKEGRRLSVPVGNTITRPFVSRRGEEYRPVDLIAEGRFVMTRVGVEGADAQQLLVFDTNGLRLAAAPFMLSSNYHTMQMDDHSAQIAVVSSDGMVERWNLLRRKLPQAKTLDIAGPILEAQVLNDRATLVTRSRTGERGSYKSRIDMWNLLTGDRLGRIAESLDVRLVFAINADNSRVATASYASIPHRVAVWDLKSFTNIWSVESDGPVDAIAFRESDTRVATIGQDSDSSTILAEHDAATGALVSKTTEKMRNGATHLVFSADGEHIIGDYDYASIAIWTIKKHSNIADPFEFSDSGGVRFELGYDIVRSLRNIRAENGTVVGDLAGSIAVQLRRDGPGTTIMPVSGDTPILSAFQRSKATFYPVQKSALVSSNGLWFALATNTSGVERSSALRIYDLRSGFPVSDLKLHQVTGGPGLNWPRLLSLQRQDADPIVALSFLAANTEIATVTTNGLLRRWPVPEHRWDRTLWTDPSGYAAALTGRQLVNARYIRRLPRAEYTGYGRMIAAKRD